jgi:hypothetical protein
MGKKRKQGLLAAPGLGGRWFSDKRKKRRRGLLVSPIEHRKKRGKRDLIERASKRLKTQRFDGADRRAGLIARLLVLINRERGVFQPPMAVVETGDAGQPQSAPVVAQLGVLQRIAEFLRGIFGRR